MMRTRDPFWIFAKFPGKCTRCGAPIKKGESIFYYPATRAVFCPADDCGQQANRRIQRRKIR